MHDESSDSSRQCSSKVNLSSVNDNPDSKIHGANMGPTWVLSAPDGPHDGPMNLAIREDMPITIGTAVVCTEISAMPIWYFPQERSNVPVVNLSRGLFGYKHGCEPKVQRRLTKDQ